MTHWKTCYDPEDGEPYGVLCRCELGVNHNAAGPELPPHQQQQPQHQHQQQPQHQHQQQPQHQHRQQRPAPRLLALLRRLMRRGRSS